jgi:hypothetical protein
MATVNATLSNFFGIAGLASRGIGTGEVRSHPSIPTFFQDMGKVQGVNYAKSFSTAVMGKGSLTNAVNSYSEEKSSFQSEFKNAMDSAKKTGTGLNNIDYGAKKDSPLDNLHQNNITGNLNKKDDANSEKTGMFINTADALDTKDKNNDKVSTDEEKKKLESEEVANEARTTPPFQAEIKDNEAAPRQADNEYQIKPNEGANNFGNFTAEPRTNNFGNFKAQPETGNFGNFMPATPESQANEVSSLMENYNNTVGFLQSRLGTSETFDHFASSFGNADELSDNMDKIGVQLEPATGMISVDTKTLSKAIEDSPDSVESILGKNGLGGRIEKSSDVGNFGSERMFPSITESLGGGNDAIKGMYGNMRQITSTPRGNLGNLMDMNY